MCHPVSTFDIVASDVIITGLVVGMLVLFGVFVARVVIRTRRRPRS